MDGGLLAELAAFAYAVVSRAAAEARFENVPAPECPAFAHGGVFVTLRKAGALRGCMGTLDARARLVEAVRDAARSAATRDPRFRPLQAHEIATISVHLSVLSRPTRIDDIEQIELGRHGIVVVSGSRRGLFLPQVATDHGLDREAFLTRCCVEKAGLSASAWRDGTGEVLVFETHCATHPSSTR